MANAPTRPPVEFHGAHFLALTCHSAARASAAISPSTNGGAV